MKVLVINAGSSSLKFQFIDMATELPLAKGLVERIGQQGTFIKYEYNSQGETIKISEEIQAPNQEVAFEKVAEFLTHSQHGVIKDVMEVTHIGHRVVHGGEKFTTTQLVSPELLDELTELIPLAPLHNPGNIVGIEAAMKTFKQAKNYAIFDTAFHTTLPAKAYRYAIPNSYYEEHAIRVYGFHGTSHKFVDKVVRDYTKKPTSKNIIIHLGNGASITAVNEKGESIDTSMGFGPNEGLVMGTRSGAIDSSVVFFLLEQEPYTQEGLKKVKNILNKESGMLGITGFSDSRDVTELYLKKDANAILCFETYAYRIQKYIGAYAAALNGIDSIAFTAGIGENSAEMREMVCEGLDFFGIKIDKKLNEEKNHAKVPTEIQASDSKVKIFIIPTNEELQIAREVAELVK